MTISFDRRTMMGGAAAFGVALAMPHVARAQAKTLVAATFPGTWNEADRNVISPAFKAAIDWEAWSGLIPPGGVVALHDSCASAARPIEEAGSVRYTRDVILHDPRFERVEVVDTLTVLTRKEEG